MCGLSAAAMKSKLFADQEEREVQRLAATVVNHQVSWLPSNLHSQHISSLFLIELLVDL
jgi:SWI/SNF related-matrix-associated actin-dependent regulator of chromatin subfamily C